MVNMWVVNTSDGETYSFIDEPPAPGEKSKWQWLISFCNESNVHITGIKLRYGGTSVSAITGKQCLGYFLAHEATRSFYSDIQTHRRGIGSVIGETVFITWIDDSGNVFQDARPYNECKMHCSMKH